MILLRGVLPDVIPPYIIVILFIRLENWHVSFCVTKLGSWDFTPVLDPKEYTLTNQHCAPERLTCLRSGENIVMYGKAVAFFFKVTFKCEIIKQLFYLNII